MSLRKNLTPNVQAGPIDEINIDDQSENSDILEEV
jgi:hypothetical protein